MQYRDPDLQAAYKQSAEVRAACQHVDRLTELIGRRNRAGQDVTSAVRAHMAVMAHRNALVARVIHGHDPGIGQEAPETAQGGPI